MIIRISCILNLAPSHLVDPSPHCYPYLSSPVSPIYPALPHSCWMHISASRPSSADQCRLQSIVYWTTVTHSLPHMSKSFPVMASFSHILNHHSSRCSDFTDWASSRNGSTSNTCRHPACHPFLQTLVCISDYPTIFTATWRLAQNDLV